ncbi:hypothetical protein GF382_03255, partial [Candidatus Falkowbacteria bacterium]|nr:hypothetical protein [Candidatus Falkowbacteria bacterium]
MKSLLLADSAVQRNSSLLDLINNLKQKGYNFYLYHRIDLKSLSEGAWAGEKAFFGPSVHNVFGLWCLYLLLPLFWIFYFFKLLLLKNRRSLDAVICVNDNERLILSPLCRFLGLGLLWIELPESDYLKRSFWLKFCLRFFGKKVKIVV